MIEEPMVLPGFVIASLYKDSLVDFASEGSSEPQYDTSVKETTPLKQYLGENKSRICIVVNDNTATYINDDDLLFLTSVLKACNLSLDDIAIFNNYQQPLVFNSLKDEMQFERFLLFGVETTDVKMPFVIPHFQVQQYAGTTIVAAPALGEMQLKTGTAVQLKRQLWDSLQRCFELQKK